MKKRRLNPPNALR